MKSRCPKWLILPAVLLLALAAANTSEAHHPHCGPHLGFNFYVGAAYRPYPYVRPYPYYYAYPYPVYPAYPVAAYPAYPAAYSAYPAYNAYSYPSYDSSY